MLVKHLSLYFIARFIPALLTLVTLSVYTRLMSPENYGHYSLTVAVAVGLNAVIFQWLHLGMARFLAESQSEQQQAELFATTIISFVVLSVLLLALNALISGSEQLSQAVVVPLIAFITCAQGWYDLCLKINNAGLKPVRFGVMSVSKSVLALALGWAMLTNGFGIEAVLITLALSMLLSSLSHLPLLSKIRFNMFSFVLLRKLIVYGGPLTLTFMMVFLIDVTGRFVLEHYHGAAEVGVFSVAYEFTQYSVGTLLAIVHLAGFPLIVKALANQGESAARLQLQKSFVLVLGISAPSAVGIALLSEEIAHLFFGSAFQQGAAALMPWVALALFFSVMKSFYFDYSFQLAQSTFLQFVCIAIAALCLVVACFLLVPEYGASGAAYASVIGFFVSMSLSAIVGRKVFPMPNMNWAACVQVALALSVMVMVVSFVSLGHPILNTALKISFGAFSYLLTLVVLNYSGSRNFVMNRLHAR